MAASLTLRGSKPASSRISVVADVHGSYALPSLPEFQRRGKVVVNGSRFPSASVCRTVPLAATGPSVPVAVVPISDLGVPDTAHPEDVAIAVASATTARVVRNLAELGVELCG